jgi:hypothetical protein
LPSNGRVSAAVKVGTEKFAVDASNSLDLNNALGRNAGPHRNRAAAKPKTTRHTRHHSALGS